MNHISKHVAEANNQNTVLRQTNELFAAGVTTPQFFILQHRYSPEGNNRHFGAALFIMDPNSPQTPKRIILCDTVHLPGWLPAFSDCVRSTFGESAVGKIEVCSHALQGLNREQNVSQHDINCSFYTRSMARALLRLAQHQPQILLSRDVSFIKDAMKPMMKDYYVGKDEKSRDEIRETNINKRWNIGRSMMLTHSKYAAAFKAGEEQSWTNDIEQRTEDREVGIGL